MKRFYPLLITALLITGCSETESERNISELDKANPASTEAVSSPADAPDNLPDGSDAMASNLTRPDANAPVNEDGAFPLGWQVRLDRPNAEAVVSADSTADVYMVNMVPGWHVRIGSPRAILYHPASTATGSYTVSSKIHLFDPGPRTEAYGLIFGGSNLDNDDQEYLYFVIRRTGEYLVKHRTGDETHIVQNWTENDAIVPFESDVTEGTAANTLAVSVDGDQVSFSVNDVEVYSMTSAYPTDGIVGFRFNHGINAHIETFDVEM